MTNGSDTVVDLDAPVRGRYWIPGIVAVIAVGHFVTDVAASHVQPLWPELQRYFSLSSNGVSWLFVVWSASTSVTQLFFGYLGDRWRMTHLIWLAPGAAAICMGCVGLSDSPIIGFTAITLGGVCVAAFHPEAAVMCGRALPDHRSRALSIFISAGFVGKIGQ